MISVAGLWDIFAVFLITLCLLTFQGRNTLGSEMIYPGKEWKEAPPESQDKIYSTFLEKVGQAMELEATNAIAREEEIIAPGKFIPTFAVKYGGTTGWPSVEEAARFDLMDVSSSMSHAKIHASEYGNTWQTLKRLNPHIKIILYKNGPALYNSASWGQMGAGWSWMTEHHGVASLDRWTAIGVQHGGYLQDKPYPNERLMNLGNRNWQEYWVRQNYRMFWSDDGWAVVNPTKVDARGVPVPGDGKARVLTHDTFLNAEVQPLVE